MKHYQAGVVSSLLAPIAAATTARTTSNLDCKGAHNVLLIFQAGVEVNTNATGVVIAILESDDTVASNFVTFDANLNKTLDNATATIYPVTISRNGVRKRYINANMTPDTTTNGAVLTSCIAVLDPEIRPAGMTNVHANFEIG